MNYTVCGLDVRGLSDLLIIRVRSWVTNN